MARLRPVVLLLAVWTTTTGAGINLAWNNCLNGPGASSVRSFACDTDAGSTHSAYISLVAPAGIFHWEGYDWEVVIRSDDVDLPSWWQLHGAGQCRNGALVASSTNNATGCTDLYLGVGTGGVTDYSVAFGGTNTARLQGTFGVPTYGHADMDAGEEYFVAWIQISNAKTVGPGACAGCAAPVCLEASQVGIHPMEEEVVWIAGPATRSHVRWQGNDPTVCPGGTPAVRSTWGAVKSLYR